MNAEIITIGDELLIGQVIDTNSAWMADQLNSAGIKVVQITTISDEEQPILEALKNACRRADVVLLTGGLGPTNDDITKHTLCKFFDTELVFNPEAYANVERLFSSRNLPVTETNRQQAMVPANCIPVQNANGTAPGMYFNLNGKIVVSMPGVPFEMKAMFAGQILPQLCVQTEQVILHKTVLTEGLGESFLADRIKDWEQNLPPFIKLAYLPQPGIVRLRLSALGNDKNTLQTEVNRQVQLLQNLIGDLIFGFDEETLPQIVGNLLVKKGLTVCTAESCTGGYLAHQITGESGSSRYFKGSIVAYDNEVKKQWLGVKPETLEQFGAVSHQTAREMAENARLRLGTDYAVSTTGIAGPTGGTETKPVGLVYIAIASANGTHSHEFILTNHRSRNIHRTAVVALNLLRKELIAG